MTEVAIRVAGIPGVARVTYARHTKPDHNTWASDWDYYGGWELSWEICDRNGRAAPWLKRKATRLDIDLIEKKIIEYLTN